jgi:hypothetical protein
VLEVLAWNRASAAEPSSSSSRVPDAQLSDKCARCSVWADLNRQADVVRPIDARQGPRAGRAGFLHASPWTMTAPTVLNRGTEKPACKRADQRSDERRKTAMLCLRMPFAIVGGHERRPLVLDAFRDTGHVVAAV